MYLYMTRTTKNYEEKEQGRERNVIVDKIKNQENVIMKK